MQTIRMSGGSASSTEVVIAHHREWLQQPRPAWANQSSDGYRVHPLYQRTDPKADLYVPNHGYELGVYLRYIVDHYDKLPNVIVFTQADACELPNMAQILGDLPESMLRATGGFLPLNNHKIWGRTFWPPAQSTQAERCWRHVARMFNASHIFNEHPFGNSTFFRVNLVCCACYAVHRDSIRAAPRRVWESVYNATTSRHPCVPGQREADPRLMGFAFEHLAHVIFGHQPPLWRPRSYGDAKDATAVITQSVAHSVHHTS